MYKKADGAINLLVLMVLVLIGAAFLIMNYSVGKVEKEFRDTFVVPDMYLKEDLLNYYIQDYLEQLKIEIKEGSSEQEAKASIITVLKNNLNLLKSEDKYFLEELGHVEKQLVAENIQVYSSKGEYSLKLSVNITSVYKEKNKEVINSKYSYKRFFNGTIVFVPDLSKGVDVNFDRIEGNQFA